MELILQELREFRQENKEQLQIIKEEIGKINARLDKAEGRIEKAEERIQNTEEVITAMLKLHTKMEDKLLDLESRSRCENIRIYGVPEEAEKESTTMISFVENLLRGGLEWTDDMPDLQIERAHRSVRPKPPEGASPRSIIIKFQNERLNNPQSMAEERVSPARKPHKSGSRLPTSYTQKTKRILRDPKSAEGKKSSIPITLPGQAARETR